MEIDIVNMISNIGFPITMCIYLIVRFEKILNNNTQAINTLMGRINK